MSKSLPIHFRQGDVLIVAAKSIPRDANLAADCVVAHGEVTGHTHRIEEGARQFKTASGEQWLEVFRGRADLVHEEHGAISLPAGKYRVIIQRTYSARDVRRARD